ETTVKQYFNVQAQSTQDWLKELDSLKISNIKTVSDETLKNSINAVRAYQNNMQNTISIALPENNDTTIISASDTTSIASGEETKDETRAASEANKNASEPASQAGGKTL
ncbi:MAG: heme biosynthesis operon protein HemX, partial [Neisseriaceae bacterium]|nr:heme biosynthesis operon protein HemX [Neisseriaceae bacterium]